MSNFVESAGFGTKLAEGNQLAQRVTLEHIKQWIAEGRGCGHGSEYVPWIKIKKRGLPGKSNLQFRFIPELSRSGHLLSAGELHLVRLLLYLGVADLREQFPCWPWPAPHPLHQHPNFNPRHLSWSKGTAAVAKKLGICHPRFPGTRLLHIPTIDVLATIKAKPDYRAVAFSVKPDPTKSDLSEWDAAKLSIQEAYCWELNIPWSLISAENIPATLRENLRVLIHHSAPKPNLDEKLARFSELMTTTLVAGDAIENCIQRTASQLAISVDLSLELFHRALWRKAIPIDLRKPWVMREPAPLCDQTWIAATRHYLIGAD